MQYRIIRSDLSCALSLALIIVFWHFAGRPVFINAPAVAPDHKLQSVSYAPFGKDQSPLNPKGLVISDQRIDADLSILSQRFHCIRTYSAIGLQDVPVYAEKYGLKMLLGAWVSADPVKTEEELHAAVALARRYPAVVQAVIVGNEALLRGEVTESELVGYIHQVKSELPGVPVTYADVWEFWLKHPRIAPATDFITIHILPYWEDNPVSIGNAVAHVQKIRDEISRKIPGKEILIGETGWPSEGRMRKGALPSLENQARFIRGFIQSAEHAHWRYNLIEAFDQPWKRDKEGAVGGYWGLYDQNRIDKHVLSGPVSNFPNWKILAALSVITALFTLWIGYRFSTMTWKRWTSFTVAGAIGAILIVLQGNQFFIISRDILEYVWAVIVLSQAVIIYQMALYAIATGDVPACGDVCKTLDFLRSRRWPGPKILPGILRLSVFVCALIALLSLLFDARYRSFNMYGFLIPAVSFMGFSWAGAGLKDTHDAVERLIALTLAAAALGVWINETPLNGQADVWVLDCLLLAWPLWRNNRDASLRPMRWVGILLLVVYAALAAMRYGLLDSETMGALCAVSPNVILCRFRSLLGVMMYYQMFGMSALILAILAVWRNGTRLSLVALAVCMCSFVFYNAGTGAVAFVAAGLVLAHRKLGTAP